MGVSEPRIREIPLKKGAARATRIVCNGRDTTTNAKHVQPGSTYRSGGFGHQAIDDRLLKTGNCIPIILR